MRQSWTDDRLDDLRDRMEEDFRGVNRRLDRLDADFRDVNRRLDRQDVDFRELRAEMNARFDSLQRTLLQIAGGMVATMFAALLTVLATTL